LSHPNLSISPTVEAAAQKCASFISQTLADALKQKATASLAISGGSSPKLLFADLARSSFDWSKVHIFWVDERCVPPTDPQSNFKLANDNWFIPGHFPEQNLHRIFGELQPAESAKKYVADMVEFFGTAAGEIPAFDVIHRGMGPDAHTASLFPDEPLIQNRTGIATNVWVEKFRMHRVTLLPAVLLAARATVLQVGGVDKADAAKHVLEGAEDWQQYPCQIASRDSKATWFLDQAAAAGLHAA
jgi:6-phosphogluconolactonase